MEEALRFLLQQKLKEEREEEKKEKRPRDQRQSPLCSRSHRGPVSSVQGYASDGLDVRPWSSLRLIAFDDETEKRKEERREKE